MIDTNICVETEEWNGYFGVMRYYVVHKDGKVDKEEKPYPVEKVPIQIDTDLLQQAREDHKMMTDTIKLFLKPIRDLAASRSTIIRESARIIFIDARETEGEWWLHLKVDDQEGFINGQGDFEKVGLVQCD